MSVSTLGPADARRPRGLYWRVHLVLLVLIAVPMTLFLGADYALSGFVAPAGSRLLPILLVSGTLAWLLRDRQRGAGG